MCRIYPKFSLTCELFSALLDKWIRLQQQLLDIGADANARPSQNYPFQISFLTHKYRYPGQRAVHIYSQRVTPLALATILGRLEIVNVLANSGANYIPPSKADLGNIDLTGFMMVFVPAGIAPRILRRYAEDSKRPSKVRSKRGDLNRLDSSSVKDFFQFIAAPESSRLCVWNLAEHLISNNYSLGLQAPPRRVASTAALCAMLL